MTATVGVAEHGNSAVLVTVDSGGELLDRRRIDLTRGLPTHPHHHEGSRAVGRYPKNRMGRAMSLTDVVALVERVRIAAVRGARESLDALAKAVPVPITSIAIRECPELPPTTEERIANNRAQTMADGVMYREALASAAHANGWSVHWYDRERVFRDAAMALGRKDIDMFLRAMGRSIGPPWQAKHKLAAAAALAATWGPLEAILGDLGIAASRLHSRGLQRQLEARDLEIAEAGRDGREHLLVPRAAQAWREMKAAALEDGETLFIVSAFRSVARQVEIVRGKLRSGASIEEILAVSAAPGYSEHHTGRAVDLSTPGVKALELEFADSSAFRWLRRNAARFAFELSYPKNNPYGYQYEPWHWCHREPE
jgi:hypothetical protein